MVLLKVKSQAKTETLNKVQNCYECYKKVLKLHALVLKLRPCKHANHERMDKLLANYISSLLNLVKSHCLTLAALARGLWQGQGATVPLQTGPQDSIDWATGPRGCVIQNGNIRFRRRRLNSGRVVTVILLVCFIHILFGKWSVNIIVYQTHCFLCVCHAHITPLDSEMEWSGEVW